MGIHFQPIHPDYICFPELADSGADFDKSPSNVYSVAMPFERLTVDVSPGLREGEKVIKVTGPLTMSSLPDFQTIVRAETAPIIILDLAQVPYIDSAGLGSIVKAHISCINAGRKLAVVGISERVRTLFRLARIEHVLAIYPTMDDTERVLNKPPHE